MAISIDSTAFQLPGVPKSNASTFSGRNVTINSPFKTFQAHQVQRLPFKPKTDLAITQAAERHARENGIEKTLNQLQGSYDKLLAGINLKAFNANKIEHYIRLAELRAGVDMTEAEKKRILDLATSKNEKIRRLVALELQVGVPAKLEKQVMYWLGQLMLYRRNKKRLQAFLDDPLMDENLKAHVEAVMRLGQLESVLGQFEEFKERLGKPFQSIGGFSLFRSS